MKNSYPISDTKNHAYKNVHNMALRKGHFFVIFSLEKKVRGRDFIKNVMKIRKNLEFCAFLRLMKTGNIAQGAKLRSSDEYRKSVNFLLRPLERNGSLAYVSFILSSHLVLLFLKMVRF